MAHVAKNLRLTNFERVYLPSNKEMYMRYGFRSGRDAYSSSGERTEPVVMNQSKIDMIKSGEVAAYTEYRNSQKMPIDTDTGAPNDAHIEDNGNSGQE